MVRNYFLSMLVTTVVLGSSYGALAQSCRPLAVVRGEEGQTEVKKTVSPPTLPVPLPGPGSVPVRNNWNTDWMIPGGQVFRKFIVTFIPHNHDDYSIRMYLKYSDGTADRFYKQKKITPIANQPIIIEAVPRPNTQPYQVNVFVGDARSIGNSYTARVDGCR